MTSVPITTRPAILSDLPQIHAIQTYYVEHSLMNFSYTPASLADMQASYEDVLREGYPYLVATAEDEILGYTYAGPFRARAAYQHSSELSIFVRSDATNKGVGGVLLRDILKILRDAKTKNPELQDGVEAAKSPVKKGHNLYQLLAIMTVDPDFKKADQLFRFYQRFGFREVGRLEKIGWKNGKWLDTRYMQMEI